MDRQLISMFADEELPSPWKEKIESHLNSCPVCSTYLNQIRHCSILLRTVCPDFAPAQERIWQTLSTCPTHKKLPLWRRTVSIPLPIVAAAALTIVFCATFLVQQLLTAPAPKGPEMALGGTAFDVESIISFSEKTGVLQYLENQEEENVVILRLPESQSFSRYGVPTIIKASDYTRR
ncbi:hypothetical protein PilKf_01442 [Pillotina sp. SPG140]|jgi:hypothetical protein